MADFTLTALYPVVEKLVYNTLVSKFDNGVEQRRSKWSSPIREFRLRFENMTDAEFQEVRDFYIAKLGAYTTFTWVNPNDSVEYTVRFKEDSLVFSQDHYGRYSFEFEMVQVI